MRLSPYLRNPLGWAAAALLGTTLPVSAQRVGGQWTLEDTVYGTEHWGYLGTAVAGPGDLDFDGYADLLVGAPGEIGNLGVVYAFSGRDRNLLWSWTGTVICERGTALDGAGDVNGDGRLDVVVGAPEWQGSPCGVVTLLHDGTVWWTAQGGGDLGTSVAGAGDVNADGYPDLIVGAVNASPGGIQYAGAAYVYSGRDGALLRQIAGAQPNMGFGRPCLISSDLDGDLHDDLLIGATGAAYQGLRSGSVFAYSARTGNLIYRLDGTQPEDLFGYSLDVIPDVDLDEIPDLAVAAPKGNGRIQIYSGADGRALDMILGQGGAYGQSLSYAGDVDRDLLPDLVVGARDFDAPGNFVTHEGAAFLYSFDPFLYADATEISATSGVPVQVELRFPDSEGGQAYALLFSGGGCPLLC